MYTGIKYVFSGERRTNTSKYSTSEQCAKYEQFIRVTIVNISSIGKFQDSGVPGFFIYGKFVRSFNREGKGFPDFRFPGFALKSSVVRVLDIKFMGFSEFPSWSLKGAVVEDVG